MSNQLENKRVAILATDGFEQSELEEPLTALEEAGADVTIVSPKPDTIQGMQHADKGEVFDVDLPLDSANPEDFDALMLPGGLMNPDELRSNPAAVEFVRDHPEFVIEQPPFEFQEGLATRPVTYWPGGYIRRVR